MHLAEKLTRAVRHSRFLEQANWLWDDVRPLYNRLVHIAAAQGLERTINGTDKILVTPKHRSISEEYEPEVWHSLMSEVRSGDVVADIGAYIGIYTIALAKRVGPSGSVIAFEPNPLSFIVLQEHVVLNSLAERIQLIQAGLGARTSRARFEFRQDQSRITDECVAPSNPNSIQCLMLDEVVGDGHLDLMKIDVEGYEEKVLEGASDLLSDHTRGPRAIYIEVHPHLWPQVGTTSQTLLAFLATFGYSAQYLNGSPVTRIDDYGEIVAHVRP